MLDLQSQEMVVKLSAENRSLVDANAKLKVEVARLTALLDTAARAVLELTAEVHRLTDRVKGLADAKRKGVRRG